MNTVPCSTTGSRSTSAAPRPARWIDDLEAARLADQAQRVEEARTAMLRAIDHIIDGTFSEPSHNKKRAKKQLVKAWLTIAKVVQDLSQPSPRYRPSAKVRGPIVHHRDPEVDGIQDFIPVSLPPALVGGMAR